MRLVELFLIAVGLSMDAFAVSICIGLTLPRATVKKATIVGLYFGLFQAAMPLIGYLLGSRFADYIVSADHWIAFVLLGFIGGRMIAGSFKREGCPDRDCPQDAGACADRQCPNGEPPNREEASLKPAKMLPLALATSIDALAVGISFAFLKVQIVPAASFIGIVTLVLSMGAVKIGNVFGMKFKSKAELIGGAILVLMGLKILLEHLGVFGV